jgi:hypothetical protein
MTGMTTVGCGFEDDGCLAKVPAIIAVTSPFDGQKPAFSGGPHASNRAPAGAPDPARPGAEELGRPLSPTLAARPCWSEPSRLSAERSATVTPALRPGSPHALQNQEREAPLLLGREDLLRLEKQAGQEAIQLVLPPRMFDQQRVDAGAIGAAGEQLASHLRLDVIERRAAPPHRLEMAALQLEERPSLPRVQPQLIGHTIEARRWIVTPVAGLRNAHVV